jgi:hypothetical protein
MSDQTSIEKLVSTMANENEVVANKVTNRSAIVSNIKYPSEKLFWDTLDSLLITLQKKF